MPLASIFSAIWSVSEFDRMLDAQHFLTDGEGVMGPQTSVLSPGIYPLNTRLYRIEKSSVTNVAPAQVGVVKSNVGEAPQVSEMRPIVEKGLRGVWGVPLEPGKYYLHTNAYEVTLISTEEKTVRFTAADANGEQSEIEVISSDGFKFPVDVRVEYRITAENAAAVVTSFQDDGERLELG